MTTGFSSGSADDADELSAPVSSAGLVAADVVLSTDGDAVVVLGEFVVVVVATGVVVAIGVVLGDSVLLGVVIGSALVVWFTMVGVTVVVVVAGAKVEVVVIVVLLVMTTVVFGSETGESVPTADTLASKVVKAASVVTEGLVNKVEIGEDDKSWIKVGPLVERSGTVDTAGLVEIGVVVDGSFSEFGCSDDTDWCVVTGPTDGTDEDDSS